MSPFFLVCGTLQQGQLTVRIQQKSKCNPKQYDFIMFKRPLLIQLCSLESVSTNAIFFRAIVQNDDPHIYPYGHLKGESRKIWTHSHRNSIRWIESFITLSLLLPQWKGKTSPKICRAVTHSSQTSTRDV